jgi:hypothetical protein
MKPRIEAETNQRVYVIGARALQRVRENEWHTVASESVDELVRPIIAMQSPFDQYSAHIFSINEFTNSSYHERIIIGFDWAKFQMLTEQWRAKRNPLSSSAWDNVLNPAYQRIVGMGITAVPFILYELRRELKKGEPDEWFVALWAITGENPVAVENRGRTREMAEAWLEWGSRQGYLHGEELGAAFSEFGPVGRV